VVAKKMAPAEMGRESFLKQVSNKDAIIESAASLTEKLLAGHEHVVLWGAGTDLHETFMHFPELAAPGRYRLVDRNPDKHGKTIAGVPIESPEALKDSKVDCVAVMVNHRFINKQICADVGECLPGVKCVDVYSQSARFAGPVDG
jgi:hypothetical protein